MAIQVGEVYQTLEMRDSEFNKSVDKAEGRMSSMAKSMGQSMQNAGKTMTMAVTGPLVGLGAAVTKTGMDFENQMARVGGIAGATGEEFDELQDLAREMGRTTSFSATESGEALEYMAMAGWSTAEMGEGLEPVLRMAEAAQMDLGVASDIASDMMSAFGMEADEVGTITDVLTKASTSANTDIEMLGETMKYAAPTANSLGLSLEETTAAAGILADAGIKGSQAGTTLNAMMSDLTTLSSDATERLKSMGVQVYDNQGNMRSMTDIMKDMEHATKDMTDEQKANFSNMVFGQRAQRGFNILMEAGADELGEFTGELENSGGAVEQMGDKTRNTLTYQIELLKSSIEGLLLDLADGLVPVIKNSVMPAIESAVGFVSDLTERFSNLDSGTQKMIITAAGIAAALGPVLIVVGKVTAAIAALNPVVAGIIAVIAGLTYAWTQWGDEIMEVIEPVVDDIIRIFNDFKEQFMEIIKITINAVVAFWDEFGEDILEVAQYYFNLISDYIKMILGVVSGIIETFIGLVTGDWERMGEGLMQIWESIMGFVVSTAENLWGLIETPFNNIRDGLLGIFENVKEKITSIFGGIVATIKGYVNNLISIVNSVISSINDVANIDLSDLPSLVRRGLSAMGIEEQFQAFEIPTIPKLADGGTALRGGSAIVGEEGPELISMPAGASVIPLTGQQGGGYKSANVVLQLDGRTIARAVRQPLADNVRIKGGLKI